MKDIFKEFDDYVSNFDINNEKVNHKYKHTYRVVEYMKKIISKENLNEHDYNLAIICALLHDIGRFVQVTKYDTYYDQISFDHGDKGYEILNENDYIYRYVDNEIDKNIVLKAVKNHNKYSIEDGLSERELYFSKLTRDADKLDIMITQYNKIKDNSNTINLNIIDDLNNEVQAKNKYINNDCERILRHLCFMYDFNFKESFNIILNNNIYYNKIKLLKDNVKNYDINIIKDKFDKYIEERIG